MKTIKSRFYFLSVPSAFTETTGKTLAYVVKARAIENFCFIFALRGKHYNGRKTFGHTMIISPAEK